MKKLAVALIMIAISGLSHAQVNLGELLDKGGKKMSGEAVKAWVVDKTFSGNSLTSGRPFEIHYRNDGSFTGSFDMPFGPVGIWGKWKVEDDGKLCVDLTAATRPDVQHICTWHYQLADHYYVSASDTDRGAKVEARTARP